MNAGKVNVYEACDKAIKAMDRVNVEAFGRLKMSDWDEISIIRTVVALYRASARKAKKRYYEVGFEAYLLGCAMCEIDPVEAQRMAEKAITGEWVDKILEETDFVTLYRFNTEMERKAYRLAETLEVTGDRDYEINKALRYWSQQIAQYAINVTDYALIQAFEDCGVKYVRWASQKDERVCHECHLRDGRVYPIDEIPPKHPNCRCRLTPAKEPEDMD